MAEGHTPDGPVIVRYRTGDASTADRELFNKLIVVRWGYEPRDVSGLPLSDDMDAMEEFETRILEASDEARWWGSCVAVVTRNGTREWRFYTPDLEGFQQEFSEALRGLGPYPLELQVFDDPDWNGLSELRDNAN